MKQDFVISELINFFIVAVVFLIGITIIFTIFCRKFKFDSKKVEIYGLLLNLNTTSLISMATLTINYLFLVWCTISFKGLNIIYILIILLLVLISDAVIDNFKGLIKSIPLALINCGAIQIIYLLYDYITGLGIDVSTVWMKHKLKSLYKISYNFDYVDDRNIDKIKYTVRFDLR